MRYVCKIFMLQVKNIILNNMVYTVFADTDALG